MLARRLRLEGDFDFKLVAQRTPGFVGADLEALTKEAAAIAVTRIFRELREAGAAAGAPPGLDRMQGGPLTPEELKCGSCLAAWEMSIMASSIWHHDSLNVASGYWE